MKANDDSGKEAVIPAVAWNPSFVHSTLLALSVTSPLLGHSFQTYDTVTGRQCTRMASLHSQPTSLQWNPIASSRLVVGYHGAGFDHYDLRQQTSSKIYETRGDLVTKMEWSADGLTLAFGSMFLNLASLFSLLTASSLTPPPPPLPATSGSIGLYDTRTQQIRRITKAHAHEITLLRWSPWDPCCLVSISSDEPADSITSGDQFVVNETPSVVKFWDTHNASDATMSPEHILQRVIKSTRRIIGLEFSPTSSDRSNRRMVFSFLSLPDNIKNLDPIAVVWDYTRMRCDTFVEVPDIGAYNYYHLTTVSNSKTVIDMACIGDENLICVKLFKQLRQRQNTTRTAATSSLRSDKFNMHSLIR